MVRPIFIDYSELYVDEESDSRRLKQEIKDKISFAALTCDVILVTDVSTSKEAWEFYCSLGRPVYIFDHHEISMSLMGEKDCFVDTKKAGTKLYAEWLIKETGLVMNGAWTQFVSLVDVYDRYDDESELWEKAQHLNRIFWGTIKYFLAQDDAQRYETFSQIQLQKFSNPFFMFTAYEQTIIEKELRKEFDAYRVARLVLQQRTDSKGNKYAMWYGPSKISIVCYRLLQDFPDIDYVIAINTFNAEKSSGKRENKVNGKLSIRSRKTSDFDVTQLKNINGHKAAGGGQFDVDFVTKLWMNKNVHLEYLDSEMALDS